MSSKPVESPQAAYEASAEDKLIVSSQFKRLWHNFRKRKVAVLGLIIVLVFVFIALFASFLAPYDPIKQDLSNMLQPPGGDHPLGTDELGRDLLSRLIYGSRISMQVGFIAVGIAFVIGVPLGIFSGYYGGWFDMICMRLLDVLMAFPGILLAICLVSILGPNLNNAILSVGIYAMPNFARMARSETLALKNNEYIEAAHALGAGNVRIIFTHVLANIVSPLIVLSTLSFGNAILTTSGLGFLGIGAQPPTPEWGAMLSNARQYITIAPHVTTIPGLAILLLVLGLNLLGDGLRDVLDPKLKDQ